MLYICLFFPAIIALSIHRKFYKLKSVFDYIIIYCNYCLFINLIINGISYFISDIKENIYDINLFTIDFSTKYLLMALIISLFLPLIYAFFEKNVKIKFVLKEKK